MNVKPLEYEVGVWCGTDDYSYDVNHQLPCQPDVATIAALRDEAAAAFERLYELAPETVRVTCGYLEPADGSFELEPARWQP